MIRRGLTAATLAATALLPAGAGLALDGPGGPAGHTLAAPGPPVGDAAGIALARRANAYYARPARMAVEIRAPIDFGVMIIRGVLEVNEWDPDARARSRIAYKIDPASGRIASIIVDGEASTVRTLETAPRIPVPKPRCADGD